MSLRLAAAVAAGLAAGWLLGPRWLDAWEAGTDLALHVLLVLVGVEVGRNRALWRDVARLGPAVLLVPLLVAAASVAAGAVAGWLVGLPPRLGAAVGAGFGWYSLSGVLLARLVDPAAGAMAFLANLARELLALVTAAPLAARLGPLSPVAAAGATAMDTALPAIARVAGSRAAVVAFISGACLTALSPLVVAWLVGR